MKKLLVSLIILLICIPQINAQNRRKKSKKATSAAAAPKPKSKNGIKPYKQVITTEAKSDDGLFTVHQVDKDYFYELPFDLLEKDLLWVTRIAQIPSGLGGGYVNAGSKTNEQVVHWTRFQNKILLKVKSFTNVADSTKAISASVKVNNYEPLLFAFDIKAFSPDSTAAVIDVTKLFSTDIPAISGLPARMRRQYKVKTSRCFAFLHQQHSLLSTEH